jgi:hypothetical protein
MASHKIAVILRSTGRLSEEEIENMSEDEAWQWLRSNASAPYQADDETGGVDDT